MASRSFGVGAAIARPATQSVTDHIQRFLRETSPSVEFIMLVWLRTPPEHADDAALPRICQLRRLSCLHRLHDTQKSAPEVSQNGARRQNRHGGSDRDCAPPRRDLSALPASARAFADEIRDAHERVFP